ncbi:MAG: indolepyruvate ferredoxin oxidoreductase family protein [Betaproteobacteria bacterium]|nr:indolepyruvate ferredoxin oxidoreductase family protein [Betaproteobacteria bacterium]
MPAQAATVAATSLDDKYTVAQGRVFLTGVQALARLPMLQHERDRAAGLNTAGFVTGYRGSPLAGLDATLHEARPFLDAHDVRFEPAVNEDLGATAVWGTQQLHLLGPARRDGIFALWYGKGPGVDRCVDVFKHANHAGTARAGGVLVVAGDDHGARSSAVAHQSEHVFSACAMPVLAPASVREILEYGLAGWALSRYSGLWVALKLSSDIVESSAVVELASQPPAFVEPQDVALPPEGLNIRWPDPVPAQELRMQAWKIYAALAWARANGINRVVVDAPQAKLGVMACGKAWTDLRQAMGELDLTDERAAALGVRVMKVGMPWPLEADAVRRFATGLSEILVVEEKRQIIEYQLKEMLYDWRDDVRPRVLGKFDEAGEWPAPHAPWLLPPTGELTPVIVARALASRLARIDPAGDWTARAERLAPASLPIVPLQRTPYFCPGCPHSRSTRVPEGSCALAGVGCHLMAVGMERRTLTISQMGGEGVTWVGMAPHAGVQHVFANMGDGTYFHSGLLAIRAAVAAGVDITYKILYNDAVAMTGGQPVDGPLTVPMVTRQVAAEGVKAIVVLAEEPGKYGPNAGFADGVRVLPRDALERVMHELRGVRGTTVIVYDQVCATELRRRRRRGLAPAAARRVLIHEALCEGCGDCGVKSNCLAVVPVETAWGRKRAIDPFACNSDLSCLDGECPALVTLEGAVPRREAGIDVDEAGLPEPVLPDLREPWSVLVAGVGGTGVVTIGALLGMAAHLDGHAATVLDQTGLAQKGGAVLTHVRLARTSAELHAPRIVHADLLLACDLLVACGADTLARVRPGSTRAVVNTAAAITGEIVRHPEMGFPHAAALRALHARLGLRDDGGGGGDGAGNQAADEFDATALATRLAGHSIAANMLLVGHAWQRGWLPVSRAALLRAIELNGVASADNRRAFAWGRRLAVAPAEVLARAGLAGLTGLTGLTGLSGLAEPATPRDPNTLDEVLAQRRAHLLAYQGPALVRRYDEWVARVRRTEQQVVPGSERLTLAVARAAHRLLAPKDDYEVARLLTDGSLEARAAELYEGRPVLHYHLAPPWRRSNGEATLAKGDYGASTRVALRWLARARWLRGTWLDPLRGSAERRLDRTLLADYEAVIERLLPLLTPERLDAAVAIATLPAQVRGFGRVRQRSAAQMQSQMRTLLQALMQPAGAAAPTASPNTLFNAAPGAPAATGATPTHAA